MNEKRLYSVGTVVKLKNSPSVVMIAGYYPIANGTEHQYLAVNYPFGLGFGNEVLLMDAQSVEKVIYEKEADQTTAAFLTSLQNIKARMESGELKL